MTHYTVIVTCNVFLQSRSYPTKGLSHKSTPKITVIFLFNVHLCSHMWTLPLHPQDCQQMHLFNINAMAFSQVLYNESFCVL